MLSIGSCCNHLIAGIAGQHATDAINDHLVVVGKQ
jgi:hypothetical protein